MAGAAGAAKDDPTMVRPEVVQTVWARLLMSGLARAGIERAIISPGSRSTPFTLASEYAGLVTETVIDERSAGFMALGCARATGRPVLLVCTSGSAGAHYFPAIIEAAYARVPLVILTANRPPELAACAAPQTIDQTHLYGQHVRFFVDLGMPEVSPASLRGLVRKAAQAAYHAQAPVPGPVHIDAPARKPLEPAEARSPAEIALVERSEAVLVGFRPRPVVGRIAAPDDMVQSLAQACATAQRGLIVMGPAESRPPQDTGRLYHGVCELAARAGFPLLVESASRMRLTGARAAPEDEDEDEGSAARLEIIDNPDLILGDARVRARLAPDLIIQIGTPPISRNWATFLDENRDCVHAVLAEHGWNDPFGSADLMVLAEPAETVERMVAIMARQGLVGGERGWGGARPDAPADDATWPTGWIDAWAQASELAHGAVERALADARAQTPDMLSEGAAMARIVSAAPRGAWLLVGNSLPVRTIDTYTRYTDAGLHVLVQRGANGIDGFVSAAAGTAWSNTNPRGRSGQPRPTLAIIGDVCFVHDLGGLAVASRTRAPLCIAVIDNRGGRIFDRLPIAALGRGDAGHLYRDHFLTEPGCDMAAAAALFGARHLRVERADELPEAIARACAEPGCTIVQVVVEPTSEARDRARIDELFSRACERSMDAARRLGDDTDEPS